MIWLGVCNLMHFRHLPPYFMCIFRHSCCRVKCCICEAIWLLHFSCNQAAMLFLVSLFMQSCLQPELMPHMSSCPIKSDICYTVYYCVVKFNVSETMSMKP